MTGRDHLQGEHPYRDETQMAMILLFLVVWSLDSLFYNWSTFLASTVPFPIRLLLGVGLVVVGGYLGGSAHKAIFGEECESPVLVDSGVFGLCRHPMYLGIVMFLLVFNVSTFSLASLVV